MTSIAAQRITHLRNHANSNASRVRECPHAIGGGPCDRDTLGVTRATNNRGMTVLLLCPWCEDEVAFALDEPSDELVCEACGTRTLFAPDPATTFSLLYEAA